MSKINFESWLRNIRTALILISLSLPLASFFSYGLSNLSFAGAIGAYIVPILLALLVFASKRFRPAINLTLFGSILIFCIGLYALEVMVSLQNPYHQQVKIFAARNGFEPNFQEPIEASIDFNNSGGKSVSVEIISQNRMAQANGNAIYALAGPSKIKTFLCNETGRVISYDSDEYGFNNPTGIWDSGDIDLVFLGDSHIYGHCEATGDTIVGNVRKLVPRTLSITSGIAGATVSQYGLFLEYVRKIKPKVLVWQISWGDLAEFYSEIARPSANHYLFTNNDVGLKSMQAAIDAHYGDIANKAMSSKEVRRRGPQTELAETLRQRFALRTLRERLASINRPATLDQNNYDFNQGSDEHFILVASTLLRKVKDEVEGWGGRVHFMYFPYPFNPTMGSAARKPIFTVFDRLGADRIDIENTLSKLKSIGMEPTYFVGTHTTAQANKLIAEDILCAIYGRNCDWAGPAPTQPR